MPDSTNPPVDDSADDLADLPEEYDRDYDPDDGDDDADPASSGDAALANEVERLREENRQLFEKIARIQADFQNSQRRLEKDADQRLKIAAGHLVREFLPVVDNLERAMEVPESADVKTVVTGVRGTYDQWMEVLKSNGVQAIDPAAGDPYDANRHEALMQEPTEGADETPHVTRVLQKGYTFDGRVLRPAQVAVSRPA